MFWFYVIIHATINEKKTGVDVLFKKNTMWIATILGFWFWFLGFCFFCIPLFQYYCPARHQ